MAVEHTFTHISVSSDDEDDFVIQAGSSSAPATAAQGATVAKGEPEGQNAAFAGDASCVSASVSAQERADEACSNGARVRGTHAVDGAQTREACVADDAVRLKTKQPGRGGEYRETTLEDLEGEKMSTAQKAVIAVAVLAIVAFALYYVVLR